MTSPRERAARRVCRFEPQCIEVCEDCRGVVDAVLDEIRAMPDASDIWLVGREVLYNSANDWLSPEDRAHMIFCKVLDAIKRGEG